MGVTGKRVEKSGIGGRARTMTGAGPTDLLYGSTGLPATYRHPGSLGPHEPCPSGPRVTIDDTIRESSVEAREERRYSERRMGTDMEDIVTFCEGACRKRCHLRVPAEESDEVTSCSSGSKTRRYQKHGLPKPSKGDAETPMEMTPSPIRRMFSAPSDSEGYHTCYLSDSIGIEPDFPAGRSHTAPNPELVHDAERESIPRRAATTRVPRHTEFGMMGPGPMGEARDVEEDRRMDSDGTGNTVMGGGEERGAPGNPPRDSRDPEGDDRHPHEDTKEAGCGKTRSGGPCHCWHVDFLIGSYPKVGKDTIIQRTDSLMDAKDTMVGRMDLFEDGRNEYQEKLETALDKQQRLLDGMVRLLEGFEIRMRTLEGLAGVPPGVPAPGPNLPRDPAPEALLRRVKTLRTVMEDVRPMEPQNPAPEKRER